MPLILGLRVGEDVYVADRAYFLDAIKSERAVVVRRGSDGKKFNVVIDQKTEVDSDVLMALGDRSTTKFARIAIDAPRDRKILPGEKYRQLGGMGRTILPTSAPEPKTYVVSPQALALAPKIGLYGESAKNRIIQMAKLAAPFSFPGFNRRYHQYVLQIEDNVVQTIDVLTQEEVEYYDSRTYKGRLEDPTLRDEAEVWRKSGPGSKPIASGSLRDRFRKR